ncbi:hypothetical protein C2G38_2051221, partial [Gigaspora rosea]
YIYTGTIPLEEVEPSIIFDLLVPSKKLGLAKLVEYIQSYLIDNKASWLRLKFTQVYSTSFQDNNFKALQTFCTDILAKHPKLIFDSDDFTSIQENALVTLLKRDDLQIEESEIWDKILAKVKPYRQLLGLDLWDDISAKFIAPNAPISSTILPARKKIPIQLPVREVPVREIHFINSSSIINDEHFAEISSWIDRCSSIYDVTKIPYKFILLLRGSKDGFTRETFHQLCDNLPGTIVVIKVNNTNEILGGYNPLVWTSNNPDKYFATTDSFIFSLKTQNLPNSILSRIIHANKVIRCARYRGPAFVGSFLMHNDSKKWYYFHNNAYYEKPLGSNKSWFFY